MDTQQNIPASSPERSYEIKPRSAELGGGWKVRFLIDGEEAGGGVFPADPTASATGIAWWNGMSEACNPSTRASPPD